MNGSRRAHAAQMTELSQERLDLELRLKPEPLRAISEDENCLYVGAVSISKRFARFSVGFAHPIVSATQFAVQHFDAAGQRGWALVLHSGGNPPHYFAGWLPSDDEARAKLWADKLNVQIQQRLAAQVELPPERSASTSNEADAKVLTCHFGQEWAPDDPWGEEVIRLARTGVLEYSRRQRGEERQHVRGRVAAEHFERLMGALGLTKFPEPPQRFFPPGATVCTLITEPPPRKVGVEYYSGLRLQGYSEILSSLHSLCAAFRDSNADALARWNFEPS
jgi:hypothetical protein